MKMSKEKFLLDLTIPINIYLLGFIWADGSLSKTTKRLTLQLTEKDFNCIKHFFECFGFSNFYEKQNYKNGKTFGKKTKTFGLSDKNISSFLEENDYLIKSTVSPHKILKNINKDKHFLFWRGYFDGDGCLYIGVKNELAFWSTIDQSWSEMIKLFKSLDINRYSIYKFRRKNGKHCSSVMRTGQSKDILKFLDYIYDKHLDLCLKRKYNKFLEFKEKIKKMKSNNTSNYRGICYNNANKKWKSTIQKNIKNKVSKTIHIGWFNTERLAILARQNEIKKRKIEEVSINDKPTYDLIL